MTLISRVTLILAILTCIGLALPAQDMDPEAITANNLLADGSKLAQANDFQGAVAKFEEALKVYQKMKAENKQVDNEIIDTWSNLAFAYSNLKDVDNTIRALEAKLAMLPTDPDLPRQLLVYYGVKKAGDKAEQMVIKAEEGKPDDLKANYRKDLAKVFEKAGNNAKQMEWLEKYREIKPADVAVIVSLANLYVESKQPAKAVTLYDDFIKTNPNPADLFKAYKNQGVLYQNTKNPAKQKVAWDNALKLEYEKGLAKNLMNLYYKDKDYKNAIRIAAIILEKDPAEADTRYISAQSKMKAGDKAGAKADFEMLQKDPKYGKDAATYLKTLK